MNVWRCNSKICQRLFTDETVGHNGKLLTCADCGEMVCNVTSTRIGQTFIAYLEEQRKSHVPSRVRNQHMNKRFAQ